jgi:hypothetical protein
VNCILHIPSIKAANASALKIPTVPLVLEDGPAPPFDSLLMVATSLRWDRELAMRVEAEWNQVCERCHLVNEHKLSFLR